MSQPFRDNLMKAEGAEEIYRLIADGTRNLQAPG